MYPPHGRRRASAIDNLTPASLRLEDFIAALANLQRIRY
jgi:hypothetical protein